MNESTCDRISILYTIKCFKLAPVFLIGLVKFMQTDCFWFLVDFIFGQKSLGFHCVLVERLTLVITRVSLHGRINLNF